MPREIDLRAADQLELRDAASTYAGILVAAFDERVQQTHGRAVMLDAVVEIAKTHGWTGTTEEAVRLLQVSGFEVARSPSGGLVLWRKSAEIG